MYGWRMVGKAGLAIALSNNPIGGGVIFPLVETKGGR